MEPNQLSNDQQDREEDLREFDGPQQTEADLEAVDESSVRGESVSWEASEFVHHEKDPMWFATLIGATLILIALSIFLIRSFSFTLLVVVMACTVIFLALRPPRVLSYRLNSLGLMINQKQYDFHDFRAFGLQQDGGLYFITLIPVKRFMPSLDVYFPHERGEEIIDLIGGRVPMKTIKPDFLDKLTRQLRF